MRTTLLLVTTSCALLACSSGSARPCTVTLTGALTRSDTCTSKNTKVMGVKTATDLNWLAQFEDDTILSNIQFQLPRTVTATTYTGGADVPWCTATVTLKGGLARSASSRPGASGAPIGSCSITFTSAVEETSGSTVSYVVAGTARATVLNPTATDASTVDVTIAF
jgi:hypothetical protein